jgi:hypothetical protein
MKKLILLFVILFVSSTFAVNDFYSPDYTNSTVVMTTDWGTTDTVKDVNVVVMTKDNNTTLYLIKGKEVVNEIYLIDGITVNVYANNQLLKTFKN